MVETIIYLKDLKRKKSKVDKRIKASELLDNIDPLGFVEYKTI